MKTLLTIILLAFTVNAHADFALWGSANLFGGASGALPPSGTTLADSLNGTTTGTFARNSLAWNPDTGAEVAINTPVYVAGKSSLGALIQPSSTNKTTSYSVPRADSLGSELNTGNLTTGTGYTVTNNDATHTVTFGAGGARYVADTSTPALNIAVNTILTPGVQYKAVIDVTVASGSVKIAGGVTTSSIPLVNGTNTVYFIANGGSLAFNRANVPVDTTFTSISIKASTDNTGISAFYSDTAAAFHNPIPNMTLSGDTAAVLSIVNDQAAIDAAIAAELVTPTGMLPALQAAKANGYKVYKLDNSLGSSNAFVNLAGDTSSTNQYYFTPVLRATSGSIKLRMSASNFTPVPTKTTSTYQRLSGTNTNILGQSGMIQADPNSVGYFIAPQLEEQPYATTQILGTTGSATTRLGDSLSYSTSGVIGTPGTISVWWKPQAVAAGTVQTIWSSYTGALDYTSIKSNGVIVYLEKAKTGQVTEYVTFPLAAVAGTWYHVAAVINADGTCQLYVNNVAASAGLGSELYPQGTAHSGTGVSDDGTNVSMAGGTSYISPTNSTAVTAFKIYKFSATATITSGRLSIQNINSVSTNIATGSPTTNVFFGASGVSTLAILGASWVGSYNRTTATLKEVFNSTSTAFAPVLAATMQLGAYNSTLQANGVLDGERYYTRALTADEIAKLYRLNGR